MSGEVATWPQAQLAPEWTENEPPQHRSDRQQPLRVHLLHPLRHEKPAEALPPALGPVEVAHDHHGLDARPARHHPDEALIWSTQQKLLIGDVLHHMTIQLDARRMSALKKPVRMWVDYVRIYQ
jgi:hypothetical protein